MSSLTNVAQEQRPFTLKYIGSFLSIPKKKSFRSAVSINICRVPPGPARYINTFRPIQHNGHHFARRISNPFSFAQCVVFWVKCHCNCSSKIQLTINQHWFRWWFGQANSHPLNPLRPSLCVTCYQWVDNSHMCFRWKFHDTCISSNCYGWEMCVTAIKIVM